MRRLTIEEQALVESHYINKDGSSGGGLVGWFIYKYRLDYDEWHGIVCESLMKAIQSYNPELGKFSPYFHLIAKNRMLNEINKDKDRDLIGFDDSIEDRVIYEESSEDLGIYQEAIESLVDRTTIAGLVNRSTKTAKLLIAGYNYNEIGEILGISTRTVASDVSDLRRQLKEMII